MSLSTSGGYRRLDSYLLASVIQLATQRFCQRFLTRELDPTGRQYDQMTQAARSGKMNIIEGSDRSGTSKETEMKLTDVAKASLSELRGDYESWLLRCGEAPWAIESPESQRLRQIQLGPFPPGEDLARLSCLRILDQQEQLRPWLEHADDRVVANTLLILIERNIRYLVRQIESQHRDFLTKGGFREQLSRERQSERNPATPPCPRCQEPMSLRQSRQGQTFWGCPRYPACPGSRPESPIRDKL